MRLARPFLALVLLTAASAAQGAPRLESVQAFVPTQVAIGKASAMLHLREWKHKAKREGMSLKEYARKVLPGRLAELHVPVVIDPSGQVRNTDAHHRIYALRELSRRTGVPLAVSVKVIGDYRGKSQREFAKDFVKKMGKGWFDPEVRDRGAKAKMASLPKSYDQLKDDPMRSAVDTAFERMRLSGKLFVDYVEFKVGEALVRRGLLDRLRAKDALRPGEHSLPPDRVFDGPVVREIMSMLREPAMRRMMIRSARTPENEARIASALD